MVIETREDGVRVPRDPVTKLFYTTYMALRTTFPILRHARARWAMAFAKEPLDRKYGMGRGLTLERYYIENFIETHKADIRGHVLEFQTDLYTTRYSAPGAVEKLDILHLDDSNPRATIIADLTVPNDIPDEHFDFIMCTCTLNAVSELKDFMDGMKRILKPGGAIHLTVPGVLMVNYECGDKWHFTLSSLRETIGHAFSEDEFSVASYGNSLVAAAAMRGLALGDIPESALQPNDEQFPVMMCSRIVKAA